MFRATDRPPDGQEWHDLRLPQVFLGSRWHRRSGLASARGCWRAASGGFADLPLVPHLAPLGCRQFPSSRAHHEHHLLRERFTTGGVASTRSAGAVSRALGAAVNLSVRGWGEAGTPFEDI